ncbi:glycosyltransferase [Mycoavidus sp. SF9855]|uniref:glycosyltransferase n=1 Tax=Mycoavidus sp. SF9855 TaxID=2968475 RepID=UPI00211BBF3C|nr:glycosyltransferase [Mycoavidus sp. SF9855]UUM21146.1 glycosyltransferase [Mycoavidus sp. SF9855]
MSAIRTKLFCLAQIVYHRIPLPASIKWRLRERLSPILWVLLRKHNISMLAALKHIVRTQSSTRESEKSQGGGFEDALDQIMGSLAVCAKKFGPISHVIALPFLGTGGAEMTAINFAKAIRELRADRTVLIVITDRSDVDARVVLAQGIHVLVLGEFFGNAASHKIKSRALLQLLLTIKPHAFHTINSEVAWQLIIEHGTRLRCCMQVIASIFALQFDRYGKIIGYAANFLVKSLPQLNTLLTDNSRFVDQAIKEFSIEITDRAKLLTVYNPARSDALVSAKSVVTQCSYLEKAEPGRKLKILWAGRLDAEKRIDFFLEIASVCEFAEFEVFGHAVLNDQVTLTFPNNVSFHGPFSSPSEWLVGGPYDAFIFTSKWEGLPNILLEVGSLGIPIIAPTVGGVGELITPLTGFPLPENATLKEYISALRKIQESPLLALNKAVQMRALIEGHHNWEKFIQKVAAIPGYLFKTEA